MAKIRSFFSIFLGFVLGKMGKSDCFSTYLFVKLPLISHFSTFKAKLWSKSEIIKIGLVAEFPGGSPGAAEFPTSRGDFFSEFTRSARGGGYGKELNDPLTTYLSVGAYNHLVCFSSLTSNLVLYFFSFGADFDRLL